MSQDKLAQRMGSMQESATLALNARAKQLAAEGKTIYNLTAGELATDTPDFIQQAVATKLHLNKYTPVAGLPELREIIAKESRRLYGLDWIDSGNVVVTGGAKPALSATLLALINPGDEVILPVPAWTTTYQPLIELAGGKVVEVPLTEEWDLDVPALAKAITTRTKAIILNSPNNPTGAIFSGDRLVALAKELKGKNITVIADDLYSKLVHVDDYTLPATCGFEKVVIINGFSKSQALTGWRIGYVLADQHIAHAVTSLLSHITGNAALPSQYAALAAMEQHDQPPQSTLEHLLKNRQLVCESLDAIPGLDYQEPDGAFYVLIDVRKVSKDSAAWCEQLLTDAGVALVPGEAFSAPGFARLTFVTDTETLTQALAALKEFVGQSA